MMIYMTHPQHGAMHVYAESEAVANEKNGWERAVTLREVVETPPVGATGEDIQVFVTAADDVDVAPTAQPVKRAPGRPKKD